jgi:hypothetical protein
LTDFAARDMRVGQCHRRGIAGGWLVRSPLLEEQAKQVRQIGITPDQLFLCGGRPSFRRAEVLLHHRVKPSLSIGGIVRRDGHETIPLKNSR